MGSFFSRSRRDAVRLLAIGLLAGSQLLMVGGSGGAAFAQSDEIPRAREAIFTQGSAGPTRAWTAFCKQFPSECRVDSGEPAKIVLGQENWDLIRRVNREVNRQISPISDPDHWGVDDRWDFPSDGRGDCEDIQILKRKLLAEAGLPRRAMRMAVVVDEDGAGHAVLMLLTDRGDFILDNKKDAVLLWQQTPYTYVKREGTESAQWVSLGNRHQPLVTAGR